MYNYDMSKRQQFALVLKHYGLLEEEEQYKVQCPFHEGDNDPSLLIDLKAGNFRCFGCNAHGGVFEFVKRMNDCDDAKAELLLTKILLQKKSKGEVSDAVKSIVNKGKQKEYGYDWLSDAEERWKRWPITRWESYSEDNYAIARGFNPKFLDFMNAKWISRSDYSFALPIVENGEFLGFVRRKTNLEADGAKYLYNKGFVRANSMFGWYDNKSPLLIVEGSLDMLKARQAGIKNVVALLGWHIAPGQLEKLQAAGIRNVISGLDNDRAGKDGTVILRQLFKVKRFKFPEEVKDIGELESREIRKIFVQSGGKISRK